VKHNFDEQDCLPAALPNFARKKIAMTEVDACRACQSRELETVLDLGNTPLANSLLDKSGLHAAEPTFPLKVVFCRCCSLVQLSDTISPEKLFRNYAYFSSFSDALLEHAKSLSEQMIKERKLGANSLVMEIASNDGYLLRNYVSAGIAVLGIEPALNIAEVARQKGINTVAEFFGKELGQRLAADGVLADVIHANNVFAHVPDTNGIVEGFRHILKPEGVLVIEVPYVKEMVEKLEFDTIYHEHVFYFSLTALDKLFSRHGMSLIDAQLLEIHGGSLRLFIAHKGDKSARLRELLQIEQSQGVDAIVFYEQFSERVAKLKQELRALLKRLKSEGSKIAVYGASAKGSTLMNFFGLGGETLDFVVDRSTAKQGMYTPGTHLPIYSPEELLKRSPDYVLLLTWNFAEEIIRQQAEYIRRGGKFIIPLPEPRIFSDSELLQSIN
jgi:SAM-dependent methyltransferase